MKSRSHPNSLAGRFGRPSLTILAFLASTVLAPGEHAYAQVSKAPLPTIPRPPATESRQAYDSTELDRVLSPVALYPDPLLAQLLTASTFSGQIAEAAKWSADHRELSGQALTDALAAERVTWDPSVQAMLAFPTVLQMMAADMPWTDEVGDAFQSQRGDVMDAVQRLRTQAQSYGYLRSNDQVEVTSAGPIEILPANPSYIVVPYYDPVVVFAPPRPRFALSSAIYFGYGVSLGVWFEPWGWGPGGFYWPSHRVAYGYPGWGRPHHYSSSYGRGFYYSPRYSPRSSSWDSHNRGRSGTSGPSRGSRYDGGIGGGRHGDGRSDGRDRSDRDARGPSDRGTRGPSDRGTRGPSDRDTRGPSDRDARGPSDRDARAPSDRGTRGPSDRGTREPSDRGPRDRGGRTEQSPGDGRRAERQGGGSTSPGASRGSGEGRGSSRAGGSGRSGRSR
ncbi:MAG: DUF3300 domain-containing protein [Gemmatimonadaceae bacterium]